MNIAEEEILSLIHPVFAVVFSFFNGKCSLKDNLTQISNMFGLSNDDAYSFIKPFFENNRRVGVEYDGNFFEFPKFILLDNSKHNFPHRKLNHKEYFIKDELDFETYRLYNGPSSISILVNTICATDCIYCYVDRKIKTRCKIPFERIKELIREAKEIGVVNFDISGTEIFLYKHWIGLITELIKNDYYPYLSTKIPINENYIKTLKEIGITNLQVSIDTVIEAEAIIVNRIKKIEGYFHKMNKTLRNLEKYDINVVINVVLTKYNSSENSILQLLNKLSEFSNIEKVTINPAEISLGCSSKEFNDFKNSTTELKIIESFIKKIEKNYRFNLSLAGYLEKSDFDGDFEAKKEKHNKRALCSANTYQMCILNDGNVTICEELYWNKNFIIGNILSNSIKEIWQSDKAINLSSLKRQDFRDESLCKTCPGFENCRLGKGVCWSNVITAYGQENWDFPSPECPYSPKPYFSMHHG
ncbi:MAG: radical SAM protein [Flavobacteriaceae bacterium]|nr:radical SAM protein [Flavobacteriaceae bacterium]